MTTGGRSYDTNDTQHDVAPLMLPFDYSYDHNGERLYSVISA